MTAGQEPRSIFPAALTDARAFAIARAMLDGFDRHYRLFREASAEAKARFEARRLARPAARAGASASSSTTSASHEAAERLRSRVRRRRRWRWTSGSEVKLHYIGLLDRPPPARVRRDVLQLGDHARSCTAATSTTTSSSCAPAISTEYIENDEPRAADLPRYYPTRDDAARGLASRRHQLPARARRSRISTATSTAVLAAVDEQLGGRGRIASRTSRSRCCARCSFATRPRTSSARSSTASTSCRSSCRSCTTTRGPARARRDRCSTREQIYVLLSQLRARLLHGRHGGAVRLRRSSCAR